MINNSTHKAVSSLMLIMILHIQVISSGDLLYAGEIETKNINSANPILTENTTTEMIQNADKIFIPGDGILINTFPDTSSFLNRPFPIDNLGRVEFPMIGKVKITDMNISELQDFLKNKFKSYLRFPNVLVKPMIRLSVLGGVPNPGLFYVDHDQSLWEVMYGVGGTVDEDGLKDMRLERDTDVVFDNLIPFFEKGVSLKNIGIQSGDQIWVPTPGRPNIWQQIREIIPVATLLVSWYLVYLNFQQQANNASAR